MTLLVLLLLLPLVQSRYDAPHFVGEEDIAFLEADDPRYEMDDPIIATTLAATPDPGTQPPLTRFPPPGPVPETLQSRAPPPAPTPAPTQPPAPPTSTRPAPTVPTPTTPSAPGPKCPPLLSGDATCSDRQQTSTEPIRTHRCNRGDLIHTCSIAGDPHIATFEGCAYHHMGAGYHVAAANRRFAAISMQKECGSSTPLERIAYECGLRPDPVTFMQPKAVSCGQDNALVVFSDAYADRLDHCDPQYACTAPANFAQTNLVEDVLVYDIKCSYTGCTVSRFNWMTQSVVRLTASNTTDTNIGTAARPVWLRKTCSGVRITMDQEFGCAGTVLEYARYSFLAKVDAGCAADRGAALGGYGTGRSPLYGRTFGLCGHIDPQGRTGCGQRPGNEYSAGGRRRPVYYDRCRQMDYGEFFQMKQWAAVARQTMCGEQLAKLGQDIYAVLAQAVASPAVCMFFAPGGARIAPGNDTWTQFRALADDTAEPEDAKEEPIVSCDTVDMFFDALGSCNMALLSPNGMTADELSQRHSSLQMCLYDACRTHDVGVAVSNTVAFRQSMQETSWQVEEIVAIAAAVVVGIVVVLVVLVLLYRRRLQKEHRQALLQFQKEVSADHNPKEPIQFAI